MPPYCPNCPRFEHGITGLTRETTRPITIHPSMKGRYNVKGKAYACDNCGAIMDKKGNITNQEQIDDQPGRYGYLGDEGRLEWDEWGNRTIP